MDRNLGRQSWKVKVERKPGPFLGGSADLPRQEQGCTGNGVMARPCLLYLNWDSLLGLGWLAEGFSARRDMT